MKKYNIKTGVILSLLLMFITACSDKMNYYLDQVQEEEYKTVYMTRVIDHPYKTYVQLTEDPQHAVFGVSYGGVAVAPTDIKVNFKIDESLVEAYNEANYKEYKMLPAECFSLESTSAVIKAGTSSTGSLHVKFDIGTKIEVGEPYLLPITIAGTEPAINIPEGFETTYFHVVGSFKPGEVPREKVGSFGTDDPGILFTRGKDIIRLAGADLLLYTLNEDNTYELNRQIGWGWSGVSIMLYMPDGRFLARKPDNNIEQYNISDDYRFLAQRTIGWGWGGDRKMFPFKNLMVLNISDNALTKYPLSQNGDWDYGQIATLETGWDIYDMVLCYEGSILAVDGQGYMWEVPLTDNGVLGAKTRMGTGWNMYKHLMKVDSDILALDENGDLWRYEFNINCEWPLVAEE